MKVVERSEKTIVIETDKGKFKYQKTKSGFLNKEKGYRIRVWSYQQGNWLSKDEITALGLPGLEALFERE